MPGVSELLPHTLQAILNRNSQHRDIASNHAVSMLDGIDLPLIKVCVPVHLNVHVGIVAHCSCCSFVCSTRTRQQKGSASILHVLGMCLYCLMNTGATKAGYVHMCIIYRDEPLIVRGRCQEEATLGPVAARFSRRVSPHRLLFQAHVNTSGTSYLGISNYLGTL